MTLSIRITDMDTGKARAVHSREDCQDSMEESMFDQMAQSGDREIICGRFSFDWLPDGVHAWHEV